jgi:pilus assembly protein Flp/PilA
MTKLVTAFKKHLNDEEGASLVEYALLLALIALACMVAIGALGTNISAMMNYIGTSV